MYAVITDFSLQSQRSRRPGTELGMPWPCPAPAPVGGARRGRGHTRWRDIWRRPGGGPPPLAPVRRAAPVGRGCARAPSAPVHARVHPSRYDGPLRSAARRGRLGEPVRSHGIHAPRTLALRGSGPCLRACMTRCTHLRPGAPVGAAMSYTLSGRGGLGGAAHLGAGCHPVAALPREPPRARGARYALGMGRERLDAGGCGRLEDERVSQQAPRDEGGCQEGDGGQDGEEGA